MNPFELKLNDLKTQILELTTSTTIALSISISIAVVLQCVSLLNLAVDYKTKILEA